MVLESNTGYTQLHRMLVEAGDRSKVRTKPSASPSDNLLRHPAWPREHAGALESLHAPRLVIYMLAILFQALP